MRIRNILSFAVIVALTAGGFYAYNSGKSRMYLKKGYAYLFPEKPLQKNGPEHSLLETNLLDRLKALETPDSLIKSRTGPQGEIFINAPVPRGKPIEWIIWHLSSAAAGTPYRVNDCVCTANDRGCTLVFTAIDDKNPPVTLAFRWAARYNTKSSRMAILIKDFKFSADRATNDYLRFPEPLTVSLVPSEKLASWTAQISNEYKKEIVVLLPMEPISLKKEDDHSSLVMVHYPEERLRRIIGRAADAVPGFAGFENLSGVRVLEDSRVMSILFSELKNRHAYFIEEAVTRKTMAPAIAEKSGVPFATIDFSIDTALNMAEIRELLQRCALESQKRGSVIVCSRASGRFIRALTDELPMLRQNGIRLSYISDIVNPK
jgi:polysaccharide deacetylase 2 family uncharacterized protein YibQ